MTQRFEISPSDAGFLDRVYELALAAEATGNLPIAAMLVRGSDVIAEAANRSLSPVLHPGRHAEVEVMRAAPETVWGSPELMTLYTSLEPCVMCFGSIVLHQVGRVIFAAADPLGGAISLMTHLPPYVRAKADAIRWLGPLEDRRFAVLAERSLERYWGPMSR